MPDLIEYRITFGTRYATEVHPLFPDAHPDGWVSVLAETEDVARYLVHDRIGNAWAFIYRPGHPGYPASVGRSFPRGQLAQWASPDVRRTELEAQRAAVLAIHRVDEYGECAHCHGDTGRGYDWPCPTALALGVTR